MIKILAAIGLGSALMLAPALALADDAAPASTDNSMAKPMSKSMSKKPMKHHTTKHHTSKMKKPSKPAPDSNPPAGGDQPKS